jgi:hypothetical protein
MTEMFPNAAVGAERVRSVEQGALFPLGFGYSLTD